MTRQPLHRWFPLRRAALPLVTLLLVALAPVSTRAQTQQVRPRRTTTAPSPSDMERRHRAQLSSAARQLELRGDYEQALDFYRQLLDAEPNRDDYFDGIRRCLVALGRYDEAVQAIEQRIHGPFGVAGAARLYAELGGVYYQQGKEQQAETAWQQALSVPPSTPNSYLSLAYTLVRLRLLDRAIDVLQQGRKAYDDPTLFANNLATLYQARMDWKAAAAEYLSSLKDSKNRQSFVERGLARFPDTPAANDAVKQAIQEALDSTPPKQEPWDGYRDALGELLASMYTKNGDYASALKVIDPLDAESDQPGERLLQFAAEASDEGYGDVAEKALRIAAARFQDPEGKAVADMTLAEIARQQGQFVRADSLLTGVLTEPASGRVERAARFRRGNLRLDELDNPDGAAKDFASLLVVPQPGISDRIRYLYAVALARMDSLDTALGQLGKVAESRGGPPLPPGFPGEGDDRLEDADPGYLAARIAFWRGMKDSTAAEIEALFKPPAGAYAENEALDLLHLVTTTKDSAALLQFAEADRAAFQRKLDAAIALYDSIAAKGKEYLHREARWRAAQLRFEAGQDSALVGFAGNHPDSPHAEEGLFLTALAHEDAGDSAAAQQLYEALLIDHPDGLLAPEARLRLDALQGATPQLPPAPVELEE